MINNELFRRFIASPLNKSSYIFIDPPWNYAPAKYKSEFWKDVCFLDIFQNINTDNLFVYVTLEKIPSMIAGYIDSPYELKALIPYASVALHEDSMYSLKNSFRNPLQFLALFQLPTAKSMPDMAKTFIMEYSIDYPRPVDWEDRLFKQFSSMGYSGVYILPNGDIGDTTSVGDGIVSQMSKRELF